ncbi:MAG: hypothetical protein EBR10_02925 [Planctomycetes bacterium]|nr:hypothetical protein [Planctomycetota bacterium]
MHVLRSIIVVCLSTACISCQDQPKTVTGGTPVLPQRKMICRIREAIAPSEPKGPVDEVLLDETSSMTVNIGDTVRVELKRSSGTGYEWQLAKDSRSFAPMLKANFDVASGKGRAEPQANGMPGGPVLDVFDFTASTAGSTRVLFVLVRPWEMEKPADRRELLVTVVGSSAK